MTNLSDMIEDVEMKIYEIQSINKCIRDVVEHYVNNSDDCYHVLPITEIVCDRLEKLTGDYSELEIEIYKKCDLNW